MEKVHFSTTIRAPRQRVWDTLFQDATYREWTTPFNPGGSWFEGDWSEGSRIRFLGPGEDGKIGGMVARIKESRPLEFLSLEHLGMIHDGKEDTTSEAVKAWTPAFENYTLRDKDGVTELLIDIDVADQYRKMFEEMWPKALEKLKALAERTT